jgi:hypothetical protein
MVASTDERQFPRCDREGMSGQPDRRVLAGGRHELSDRDELSGT